MSSGEEVLAMVVTGIPRVAEKIAGLTEEQRAKAFEAVERTYTQIAADSDYAEADVRDWVNAVMDNLRADVEERTQHESHLAFAE